MNTDAVPCVSLKCLTMLLFNQDILDTADQMEERGKKRFGLTSGDVLKCAWREGQTRKMLQIEYSVLGRELQRENPE